MWGRQPTAKGSAVIPFVLLSIPDIAKAQQRDLKGMTRALERDLADLDRNMSKLVRISPSTHRRLGGRNPRDDPAWR